LVHADWEAAQARYERSQVLEDKYALLAAVAEGHAIGGEVVSVDTTNSELGPSGKRRVSRPLLTVSLLEPCPFPDGTDLWWTDRTAVGVCLESAAVSSSTGGATVVLKVVSWTHTPRPDSSSDDSADLDDATALDRILELTQTAPDGSAPQ
jgi:hypothetical protein